MGYTASVITVSDRCFNGVREDLSGKELIRLLEEDGFSVSYALVSDDVDVIKKVLTQYSDLSNVNLILTTGGTGLSERDVTPEATLQISNKTVYGISEALRLESAKKTPFAFLSRGVSVIRNKTLIINLPGSLNAVKECYQILKPMLFHAIKTLLGEDTGH